MDSSKNLNLNLPGQTDFYNVDDFNENFNIIDEKIKELEDFSGNVTPEEIVALSLENESLSNIDFLAWVKSQKTSKFFTVNSDCTNLPATENFIGEIQAHHDGLWKKVLMLSIYGNGTPARMFTGVELNGNWSGWNEYLLTNGNVPMNGGLKVNGGYGSLGAIEQYTSISHIEEPGTNNYRNLTVTNQGETSEAVVLHEVRNGVETKTHKIYGEHNKPNVSDVTNLQSTLDGKAPSTHSHSISDVTNLQSTLDGKAPNTHNQAASTITAGTFAGQVNANATAMANVGAYQIRNIAADTIDLTPGVSSLATGQICFIFE